MNAWAFVLPLLMWSTIGCSRSVQDRAATTNPYAPNDAPGRVALNAANAPKPPVSTREAVPSAGRACRARPSDRLDVQNQFDVACRRARRDNRRVLIQWAQSQAPWSVVLEHQLRTDGIAATVTSSHCLFMPVHMDKDPGASALACRLGVDLPESGLPRLSIVNADGKTVVTTPANGFRWSGKLEEGYDTERLADWVLKYKVDCPAAEATYAQAQKQATSSQKPIFLHICAPYCGPCRLLDAWLARPEISAIIDANFIDCPIDLERTPGAKDFYKRFSSPQPGVPSIAFLDAKDTVLAKFVGFPDDDKDIAQFLAAVSKGARSLSEIDIETLRSSLARPSVASKQK
jgi:hypothetical protein